MVFFVSVVVLLVSRNVNVYLMWLALGEKVKPNDDYGNDDNDGNSDNDDNDDSDNDGNGDNDDNDGNDGNDGKWYYTSR